jgi:hypothetical protein
LLTTKRLLLLAMSFITGDPFVALRFVEVFTQSFSLFKERLGLFLLLGVIWYIPLVITLWSIPETPIESGDATADAEMYMGALMQLELFVTTLISIIMRAAISIAVAMMYNRGIPDAISCLKKVWSNLCGLFCGYMCAITGISVAGTIAAVIAILLWLSNNVFLQLIAVMIGTAVVAAFAYVMLALLLFVPIVMIEQKGPIDGLKRSSELLHKGWCLVLGTNLLLILTGSAVSWIMAQVPVDGILGSLLKNLPSLFLLPFGAIVGAVVYLNLRVIHEGLNREMLTGELNIGSLHDQYVVAGDDVEANTETMREKE